MNDPPSSDRASAAQLPVTPAQPRSAADLSSLLARLWTQNLPVVRERVSSLEATAQDLLHGDIASAQRAAAQALAHQLAGSLGMFGYNSGTEISRKIEQLLEVPGVVDAVAFARLVRELRSALPL